MSNYPKPEKGMRCYIEMSGHCYKSKFIQRELREAVILKVIENESALGAIDVEVVYNFMGAATKKTMPLSEVYRDVQKGCMSVKNTWFHPDENVEIKKPESRKRKYFGDVTQFEDSISGIKYPDLNNTSTVL